LAAFAALAALSIHGLPFVSMISPNLAKLEARRLLDWDLKLFYRNVRIRLARFRARE